MAEPAHHSTRAPRAWRQVAVIFCAALVLRTGFALTRPEQAGFPDAKAYDAVARSLLEGRGLRERADRQASRAPGYPVFLAACYRPLGPSFLVARLVQAALGAASCVLVYLLGRRIFNRGTGLIAAAIAAVYPFFVFYTGLVLAETLFIFALLGVVLLLTVIWQTKPAEPKNTRESIEDAGPGSFNEPKAYSASALRILLLLCCGAVLGIAVLIRSSLLLFLPFILPFWVLFSRRRVHSAGQIGLMALGLCATISPWVHRNYKLYHRVVLTTLQVGESLYEANSPDADGGPHMDLVGRIDWQAARDGAKLEGPEKEYERDRYFRREAVRYIRGNPRGFGRLALTKLRRFWNPVPNYAAYRRPLYMTVSALSFGPVVLFAILGVALARKRWQTAWLLAAPVVYYSVMHMIFVGSTRYRTPVMPFVIVLAAFALSRVRPERDNA